MRNGFDETAAAPARQTKTEPEPGPLADREAELALLGCLMLDPDYTLDACRAHGVTAESFYYGDHARLFAVLVDNLEKSLPADATAVGFDAPELRAIAADAMSSVSSYIYAPGYAGRVADLAGRRRLVAVAQRVVKAAYDGAAGEAEGILAAELVRQRPGVSVAAYDAATLLNTVFPEPTWLVQKLIPAGLVVLAGRPKLGKSWLALQLAGAVASGGKFLDTDTPRRGVLYVALEDTPRRIKDRLLLQRTPADAWLYFLFEFPHLSDNRSLLELERKRKEGCQLFIVDTLTRALGKIDQNDHVEVGLVVSRLQRWAVEHEVCLLFVDHHRKPAAAASDLVSDVLGATSKTAVADAVMGLYRKRGQTDATLAVTGRDIAERELVVTFDHAIGCWQLKGDAETVVASEKMQQLLDALATTGEATHRELYEATGQEKSHSFVRLQELVARGLVVRTEGRPVRFRLADRG